MGFSSVFFVRFSVRSRRSPEGPFWTPGGPQNRLQIGAVAPARLGVAPGAVSGRSRDPPGPVLGSKTGGPDPHETIVKTVSGAHLRVLSARAGQRGGKVRKSKLKLIGFGVETGPGDLPKFPGPPEGVRKAPPEGVRERTQNLMNFREMEKSEKRGQDPSTFSARRSPRGPAER